MAAPGSTLIALTNTVNRVFLLEQIIMLKGLLGQFYDEPYEKDDG